MASLIRRRQSIPIHPVAGYGMIVSDLTAMERFYPPEYYDRHLTLRVPFHMMLAMLYAARHIFIVMLAYSPGRMMGDAFAFMQPLAAPMHVFAGLPAILVLLAWNQRRPEAKAFWRTIWRNGRLLLSISLLVNFALLAAFQGVHAWKTFDFQDSSKLVMLTLGFDLVTVYYLWRVPLVKDVFSEFPKPPSP
jgi:Protein of unknown function (DUF2919)